MQFSLRLILLKATLLMIMINVNAQPLEEGPKLVGSDTMMIDQFGTSVDISGDYAVIGTNRAEAVYVFQKNGTNFSETQILTASNGSNNNRFGRSVSIDGNRILVGAPRRSNSRGSAYVFELMNGQWVETFEFVGPNRFIRGGGQVGNDFGQSVLISGDYAIIGATGESSNVAGSVYVYKYNGSQWVQETRLFASDVNSRNNFGSSTQILNNRIYVGAPFGAGAVYEYVFDGMDWVENNKITPLDPPTFAFGNQVDVNSENLFIAARNDGSVAQLGGAAFVYSLNSSDEWVQTQELFSSDLEMNDQFGYAMDLHDDSLVITSFRNKAYLFKEVSDGWREVKMMSPSEDVSSDIFGFSAALENESILIGSILNENQMGAVFTFINDLIFVDSFEQ